MERLCQDERPNDQFVKDIIEWLETVVIFSNISHKNVSVFHQVGN